MSEKDSFWDAKIFLEKYSQFSLFICLNKQNHVI